jgi:peptide/nickel transport system permease protein
VTAFIIRRVFFAVVVLLLITIMVFLALRLLPGDPILMLVTSSQLSSYSQEQIDKLRHEFGLDRPLIVQYFSWIGGMFHGDFGISIINRTPVINEIARRLPITINIGIISFIIGNLLGFAVGIASAVRRGSLLDNSITTGAYLGQAIPQFWLALVLVYIFGLQLRWLPIMGYTSPFVDLGLHTRQLILPVICECIGAMAMMARQVRSSMLEVIRQDYIRTAWSKGLEERTIMLKHALKNALIPIVTIAGMAIPMILGGSVFVETVFNIPGMGRLLVTAIQNKDYPYVQAITMITTTAVVFTNLLVDLAYGWLDPRVRYH